eukprot:s172_g12.t5
MAKPIVITLKNPAARDGRDARDASRSRSPVRTGGVMDLAALEGHVTQFQEELNELQGRLEAKCQEVRQFLEQHGHSLDDEAGLANLVPILIKMLEEELSFQAGRGWKSAFKALSATLEDLAKRHGVPLEKKQPLDLLKALLRRQPEEKSEDESYSYSDD